MSFGTDETCAVQKKGLNDRNRLQRWAACSDGGTHARNCADDAVDETIWDGTYGLDKNDSGLKFGPTMQAYSLSTSAM